MCEIQVQFPAPKEERRKEERREKKKKARCGDTHL
jgi:hypothetical protein